MKQVKAPGADISVVIRIVDSTDGTPETGVVAATAGLSLNYRREGGLLVNIAGLSDLALLTTAHTDGGLLHISDGYYRVDVPDAAFAAASDGVLIEGTATGMVVIGTYVQLVGYDPRTELTAAVLANIAAILADTGTDGVIVGPTQPAITWGQQKIVANVANEGALDIVNAAAQGYGQRNVGGDTANGAGTRNIGYVGLLNDGAGIGNENNATLHGLAGVHAFGQYNCGPVGEYNEGTGATGIGVKIEGNQAALYGESAGGPVADLQGYAAAIPTLRIEASGVGGTPILPDLAVDGDQMDLTNAAIDAIYEEALAPHDAVVGSGAEAWATAATCGHGPGSVQRTYTVTDSGTGLPIDAVQVWVSTDVAGVNIIASGYTDALGQYRPWLDAGTYYFWSQRAGYSFTNPDQEVFP